MQCPTCDKQLSTERGMRQHHTKVHGDPLPNRTCTGCGLEFYDPKSRRSFCDGCNPNAGEHNGNWSDATEQGSCKLCGARFEYYPSNKPGVYCSDCVKTRDEFLGIPYREVHSIKRLDRECEFCDAEMTVLRSAVKKGQGRFCSQECLAEWMSDQWGGSDPKYTGRWREVRRQARKRDRSTCQRCGKHREVLGQEPDVHHIKPVRKFEDPQQSHKLSNVVCLCKRCHALVEIGKVPCPNPPDYE
ncbi:HNH endonuclease [Halobacteria archaeon AArc-curdl1]|uniref:HNH endonuclease n=2 Tax=Natronosalvus hydrolyticus TaxID=2979988 RepID=A0AAP3E4T2_9EURY|nr:HNH endonuclease [Halobacteria archaeon AArc-curdl1]